jgi:hypothetical protein
MRPHGALKAEPYRQPAPATGYAVVLPPGWRRIPLRSGTRKAIREIAEQALSRLPGHMSPDQAAPHRIRMEQRLAETARKARQAGGIDLYLPVEPVHGTPVPASFVVAAGTPPAPGPVDCGQVIGRLLADRDDAEPVVVDGAAGVRLESTAAPDPAHGIGVESLRVDYIVPLPGSGSRWLIITFSTPGNGDPNGEFAKLLAQLFDAIMLTFRWTADNVSDEQ